MEHNGYKKGKDVVSMELSLIHGVDSRGCTVRIIKTRRMTCLWNSLIHNVDSRWCTADIKKARMQCLWNSRFYGVDSRW